MRSTGRRRAGNGPLRRERKHSLRSAVVLLLESGGLRKLRHLRLDLCSVEEDRGKI